MDLAEVFTIVKKDLTQSSLLPDKYKQIVRHLLKISFQHCILIENKKFGYAADLSPSGDALGDFERLFGDIFNK